MEALEAVEVPQVGMAEADIDSLDSNMRDARMAAAAAVKMKYKRLRRESNKETADREAADMTSWSHSLTVEISAYDLFVDNNFWT